MGLLVTLLRQVAKIGDNSMGNSMQIRLGCFIGWANIKRHFSFEKTERANSSQEVTLEAQLASLRSRVFPVGK